MNLETIASWENRKREQFSCPMVLKRDGLMSGLEIITHLTFIFTVAAYLLVKIAVTKLDKLAIDGSTCVGEEWPVEVICSI